MKYLFLSAVVCFSGLIFGQKDSVLFGPGWSVIADVKDDSIPSGEMIIEGNVKMFSSAMPLSDVRVGTNSNEILSDSLGNFSLKAMVDDTVFFCYRTGWSEIYELNPAFRNQHRITVEVYMSQRQQIMKKPIIYLYNDEQLEVDVKVKPKGAFTFTYPKYENGWSLFLNPNGGMVDMKSNQEFPYLFWEAETEGLFFDFTEKQMEGWVIKTDSCISFLERQLTSIGLNETEQTDFITFWAPILSHSDYAVVQFLLDDAYENQIAEMEITPNPDAMRRVYLLMAPLDRPFIGLNMVPQTFSPFNRTGFTVLEWGGTELDFLGLKF
tara:strand:- start:52960 stop:53931 length:972 start_codon:yes stop_codon:yes gene_type:complete